MSNGRIRTAETARHRAAYMLALETVRSLVKRAEAQFTKSDPRFRFTAQKLAEARLTLQDRRNVVAHDIAAEQGVSVDVARSELLAAELIRSDYRVNARELRRERDAVAVDPRRAEKLS